MNIVIVDDEPVIRDALYAYFSQGGHTCKTASTGNDALNLMSLERPDVVVTDYNMPEMNGIELLRAVRDRYPGTRVIMLTGYADLRNAIDSVNYGAYAYFEKPLRIDNIVAAIHRIEKEIEQAPIPRDSLRIIERSNLGGGPGQDAVRIDSMIDAYRREFRELRQHLVSAAGAFHNLIDVDTAGLNVPLAYRYRPFSELGGDSIHVRNTPRGCTVLITDVSGHDMGASYHSILIKVLFEKICTDSCEGHPLMETLNSQLLSEGREQRMVTALFLDLDLKSMRGEVIAAGHPPLVVMRSPDDIPTALSAAGDVLGVHRDATFEKVAFRLAPGYRLVLTTDGLTNAHRIDGRSGRKWRLSQTGFFNMIMKYGGHDLQGFVEYVVDDVVDYCRHKLQDDMLLAAIDIP